MKHYFVTNFGKGFLLLIRRFERKLIYFIRIVNELFYWSITGQVFIRIHVASDLNLRPAILLAEVGMYATCVYEYNAIIT